jgi:hypothetical protein
MSKLPFIATFVFAGLSACGGSAPLGTLTSGPRESGQSQLMAGTFAGQNKCNPKNADRPFVVEWDGTDMSSFEAHASSNIVLVEYQGCELKVLDRCRDDSIRGAFGAYRPVEWTSGQLETVDIESEDELYTKLPLGAASLGGRVHAGEKFHMEYYVAGTRAATRAGVYRGDLAKNPHCKNATHFVYAYNLGAFALGSLKQTEGKAEGSLYGFGAGGSSKRHSQADKRGGDLGSCKADSATEIQGCKAPIRLTLRELEAGENPDKTNATAADDSASLNAAGKVSAQLQTADEARAHATSATQKMNAGDGPGCLQELDLHDRLDPKNVSTDSKTGLGLMRAQCLMLAGQCDAGKQLARKSFESSLGPNATPDTVDKTTDGFAVKYCQGDKLSPRDQLMRALKELNEGARGKPDKAFCQKAYDTVLKLRTTVKPRGEDDDQLIYGLKWVQTDGPGCFAQAKDCDTALKVWAKEYPKDGLDKLTPAQLEQLHKSGFSSRFAKQCPAK